MHFVCAAVFLGFRIMQIVLQITHSPEIAASSSCSCQSHMALSIQQDAGENAEMVLGITAVTSIC